MLAAVQAAVAAAPDNHELRLQLAIIQLETNRPVEALDNAVIVLGAQPDDERAAAVAANSAWAVGDTGLATGYERLADALRAAHHSTVRPGTREAADSAPTAPAPGDAGSGDEETSVSGEVVPDSGKLAVDEDELDTFLRHVLGEVEPPAITLADVGGLEDVKKRLATSFLTPMRNPELRQAFRKSLRGGLLLYGPPGCGKTYLARAIAGELGARFVSFGLADVVDMYYGKAVCNLHELFAGARRVAPCVLFLDEIDALGQKRAQLVNHAARDTVAQLLTELDGMAANNDGVFVLGATNRPWDVDEALRRPGRFDRVMLVLPPDRSAREYILAVHVRERPVGDLDLAKVAVRTERFSGADLALVCESAAEEAMEESALAGQIRPITTDHLLNAAKAIPPSTLPWFESARNYALYANQAGAYDDLLAYLRANRL